MSGFITLKLEAFMVHLTIISYRHIGLAIGCAPLQAVAHLCHICPCLHSYVSKYRYHTDYCSGATIVLAVPEYDTWCCKVIPCGVFTVIRVQMEYTQLHLFPLLSCVPNGLDAHSFTVDRSRITLQRSQSRSQKWFSLYFIKYLPHRILFQIKVVGVNEINILCDVPVCSTMSHFGES